MTCNYITAREYCHTHRSYDEFQVGDQVWFQRRRIVNDVVTRERLSHLRLAEIVSKTMFGYIVRIVDPGAPIRFYRKACDQELLRYLGVYSSYPQVVQEMLQKK